MGFLVLVLAAVVCSQGPSGFVAEEEIDPRLELLKTQEEDLGEDFEWQDMDLRFRAHENPTWPPVPCTLFYGRQSLGNTIPTEDGVNCASLTLV